MVREREREKVIVSLEDYFRIIGIVGFLEFLEEELEVDRGHVCLG